jgi:hypothetical protein
MLSYAVRQDKGLDGRIRIWGWLRPGESQGFEQ